MSVLAPFNPAPEIIDALIDELGNPDCTLRDIANQYKTTLEALTLWLTRDDIAARLNNIESAVCRRTRLIATNFMPCVARLCTIIVSNHFEDEHELDPGPVTNEPRRRSRDGARKAGALLLRLARLFPSSSPPPSKPDASMPHASMPSSSFSPAAGGTGVPPVHERPNTPELTTQPHSPDRRDACPTNSQAAERTSEPALAPPPSLPNLVAQASGLCPSPSTSSCVLHPSPLLALPIPLQPISGFASLIPGVPAGSTRSRLVIRPARAANAAISVVNSGGNADIFSGSMFAQPPKPG